MFKRIFSMALVFGAAALAPPAEAQAMGCLPRESLVQKLTTTYSEKMTAGGLQNPQQLLEIWSSEKTGSFTVFITRPNGVSCVVATGQYWNSMTPKQADGITG